MSEFDDLLGSEIDERSEKAIQNDALIALTALPDSMLWRNNTGQAWQGREVRLAPGQMFRFEHGMKVLREARPVRFGLEGSADIIGAVQRVPVAVEMKDAYGRQRRAQVMFERAWVKAGGIYVLARTADEAERSVNKALALR